MLIDRSYFIGELNIPNTDQVATGELVDAFIEKYEEKFLTDVLGYNLYKAFKAGLLVMPVDQKWTDLIQGVEYTNLSQETTFYVGLVSQPPSVLNALDALNTIQIIVGGSGQYDPVAGQPVATIPSVLVGKDFIIVQRAFGQLRADEYSIVGNQLTLLTSNFSVNDTYFYKSATLAINTSTGVNKQSPIANYVYYWYMRNVHTQTASMGEVKSKNENAIYVNPALKLVRAWNEMSEWVINLVHYLDALSDDYPEWEQQNKWCMLNKFCKINEFNI